MTKAINTIDVDEVELDDFFKQIKSLMDNGDDRILPDDRLSARKWLLAILRYENEISFLKQEYKVALIEKYDSSSICLRILSYWASNEVIFSATGQIATSGKVYMSVTPRNPVPRSDGVCPDNEYVYTRDTAVSYHITYCLSEVTGGIAVGTNYTTAAGISD